MKLHESRPEIKSTPPSFAPPAQITSRSTVQGGTTPREVQRDGNYIRACNLAGIPTDRLLVDTIESRKTADGMSHAMVRARWTEGAHLHEVKKRLPHGRFLPWYSSNGWTRMTVQDRMQLYAAYPNPEDLRGFTSVRTALRARKPRRERGEDERATMSRSDLLAENDRLRGLSERVPILEARIQELTALLDVDRLELIEAQQAMLDRYRDRYGPIL